jgi:nucleotide-binding universal stress UspA family protein
MRSNTNMRKTNTQPAWKILAPIDLSINAERPVEHATNIALAMGAELTLLYVVDQRCNSRRGRLRWPSNVLNDVLTDCAVHRLILPAGNPAETIARYAEFINADLLAMTSEHYGRGRPESSWKLKRRFIPGSHRIGVLNPWKGEPP